MATFLWCKAPSHRYFCTALLEAAVFDRFLIGLTDRLLFNEGTNLSDRLSKFEKLSELYILRPLGLATYVSHLLYMVLDAP